MFEFAYQPIWNIGNDSILGYEVLMRPPSGLSPVDVIEQHRADGTIIALDQRLIRQAMDDFKSLLMPGQLLMVNTEPETLRETDWSSWTFPLHPSQVVFEITERATLDDLDLRVVPHIGIQFALDDFGTGMSNLIALEKLKPTFIKMGREFLENHDDHGVLALLSGQFSKMGAQLIVEGVENERDLSFLRQIGVRFAQGFLLGRPMFAAEHRESSKESMHNVANRS